jgi:hypothetical protein
MPVTLPLPSPPPPPSAGVMLVELSMSKVQSTPRQRSSSNKDCGTSNINDGVEFVVVFVVAAWIR